jgi:hypothetical protein
MTLVARSRVNVDLAKIEVVHVMGKFSGVVNIIEKDFIQKYIL